MSYEQGLEQHPCRNCENITCAVSVLVQNANERGTELTASEIDDYVTDLAFGCPGSVTTPINTSEFIIDLTDDAPQIIACGKQSEIDFLREVTTLTKRPGAA